jgi:RNA polymerase sigma-54 factor
MVKEPTSYEHMKAEPVSLSSHLAGQLGVTQLSERDKRMVSLLVDTLNEDGYLTQSLESWRKCCRPEVEIEPTALKHLQNLDPPVSARDLAECLTLQLEVARCTTARWRWNW